MQNNLFVLLVVTTTPLHIRQNTISSNNVRLFICVGVSDYEEILEHQEYRIQSRKLVLIYSD